MQRCRAHGRVAVCVVLVYTSVHAVVLPKEVTPGLADVTWLLLHYIHARRDMWHTLNLLARNDSVLTQKSSWLKSEYMRLLLQLRLGSKTKVNMSIRGWHLAGTAFCG